MPAPQTLSLDDQLIVPLYDNSCLYLINCLEHWGHWEIGLNKHYCRYTELRKEKRCKCGVISCVGLTFIVLMENM